MDGRFTGYTDQSRQRTIQWLSDLSHSMDLSHGPTSTPCSRTMPRTSRHDPQPLRTR
jgi:hypothetical protein